jgi:hypothetical protein
MQSIWEFAQAVIVEAEFAPPQVPQPNLWLPSSTEQQSR